MQKFVSIAHWRDLSDNHLYATGDAFPHDWRDIPEERIAELSGKRNKAGFALIQAVEIPNEEKPVQQAGSQKKATRIRKKAT